MLVRTVDREDSAPSVRHAGRRRSESYIHPAFGSGREWEGRTLRMKVEACSRSRAVALWCQFRSELGGACSLLSASSVATPTSTLSTITPHPPDYIPPCYQDYSNTCKYSRIAITFVRLVFFNFFNSKFFKSFLFDNVKF